MRISEIAERMRAEGLLVDFSPGETDLFDRAVFDSREVEAGFCYVAIKGHAADGHAFIDKAVKNGAVAIVYEAAPAAPVWESSGAARMHVSDSRKALLRIARLQAGLPADGMALVGTTGTNGKTTVATLMRHLLGATGRPCGFIGTTGYSVGATRYEARETTPSPVRVYDLLAEMKHGGCRACSMEVSSHALEQHRVEPEDFDAAIFTNLTRDHLDYHGSETQYFAAKKRLFDGLRSAAVAISNADDAYGLAILKDSSARPTTFGTKAGANIRYGIERADIQGLQLALDGGTFRSPLSGRFNAANLAAAYAAGVALGLPTREVALALEQAPPVPGRFEKIRAKSGTTVIVDYAHTPDALENILEAVRAILPDGGRLWCVFGCGGDRDVGKRPIMGAIAERLADRVVVTSDNSRSEHPAGILDDIRTGLRHPERAHFEVERRDAIEFVARFASPGDLVVLAGRGSETVQVVGSERRHFDDRETVREVFGVRDESETTP